MSSTTLPEVPPPPEWGLLGPNGDHQIGARRPPGGHQAGCETRDREERDDTGESRRIRRADHEDGLQHLIHPQRSENPRRKSDRQVAQGSPEDKPGCLSRLGTERNPDSDLPGSLGHRGGGDGIHPDRRQDEGDPGEGREHQTEHTVRPAAEGREFLHGHRVEEGKTGIDGSQRFLNLRDDAGRVAWCPNHDHDEIRGIRAQRKAGHRFGRRLPELDTPNRRRDPDQGEPGGFDVAAFDREPDMPPQRLSPQVHSADRSFTIATSEPSLPSPLRNPLPLVSSIRSASWWPSPTDTTVARGRVAPSSATLPAVTTDHTTPPVMGGAVAIA